MAAENWMINVPEKLKELGMELASFGGSLVSKASDLFPPQKVHQRIQGAVPNMKAMARKIGPENSINFLPAKLKELELVVEKYGGILITKVDEMFPVLKNRVEELQIWFHVEKFPAPKNRVEEPQIWFQVAKPYIVPVAVLVLCFYCCRRCCGGGRVGKMMKAPGRNFRMPRAPFERNPRAYFRDLRGKID